MKKEIVLLLIVLTLVCCGKKKNIDEIEVDGQYALVVPTYLTLNNTIDMEHMRAYGNEKLGVTLLIGNDNKKKLKEQTNDHAIEQDMSTLIGYSSYWMEHYLSPFQEIENIERETLLVNGMPAVILYINGILNDKPTTLAMAFIEGKENNYQMVSHYPTNNNMELRNTIAGMFETFREIE